MEPSRYLKRWRQEYTTTYVPDNETRLRHSECIWETYDCMRETHTETTARQATYESSNLELSTPTTTPMNAADALALLDLLKEAAFEKIGTSHD